MSAFPGIYDVPCSHCSAKEGDQCITAFGTPRRNDPHAVRWHRHRRNGLNREFIVRILKTDERLGVREGEEYAAVVYWLDPGAKVTLLRRIPDGYDPSCNQYWHDAEFVRWASA